MDINESDLHPHLKARMDQRGITLAEIRHTLAEGWQATDAKPGMSGKTFVFIYEAVWEGKFYAEKEVSVYFKTAGEKVILLTAKARYGKGFPRQGG